jgi:hypothetical protein
MFRARGLIRWSITDKKRLSLAFKTRWIGVLDRKAPPGKIPERGFSFIWLWGEIGQNESATRALRA